MEAYRALVAEGGRPSHPVALGYDVIDNPDKYEQYKDIIWFWHGLGGYYSVFHRQLMEWREFRQIQDKRRSFYIPRNRFQEYQDAVRESQADTGCKWHLRVLEDRHQQNRLEDWNEFRAFYYRRLKAYEKLVPPAEQELLLYQKKYEDAQARSTNVIRDPQVLYGRFDDIQASMKEVAEAKSRVESAEKALQAAKKNRSKRKEALIKKVQEELAAAKAQLIRVSGPEEMRKLRDGYELHIAKKVMLMAEGDFNGAELDVKRWKVFLKWIDDQYPAIAAECGCLASDTTDVSSRSARGKEDQQIQKRRPQPRQKGRTQIRSVLSPNTSSKISKFSKPSQRRAPSSSLRAMVTTQPPLADPLQDEEPHVSKVLSSQQGDDASSRESRLSPCLTKSTLQPTRRSARIAERVRRLQDSNGRFETVTAMSNDAHVLSTQKSRKGKNLKKAITESGEHLKGVHPSKPQGVTKRRGRPRRR